MQAAAAAGRGAKEGGVADRDHDPTRLEWDIDGPACELAIVLLAEELYDSVDVVHHVSEVRVDIPASPIEVVRAVRDCTGPRAVALRVVRPWNGASLFRICQHKTSQGAVPRRP